MVAANHFTVATFLYDFFLFITLPSEDDGSSPLECSGTYRGPEAASEPETQAVQDFVSGRTADGEEFEAFLTFHTYGYYWLVPFGNCTDPPNGQQTVGFIHSFILVSYFNGGGGGTTLFIS